jgi:hypothetical protein
MAGLAAFLRAPTLSVANQAPSSRFVLAIALLLLAAANVAAQATVNAFQPSRCVGDTTSASRTAVSVATADTVAPGISYRCLYVREGPWAIHVVSIDLAAHRYAVEGARAQGAMLGRERVTDMVQRLGARSDTPLVAINADFFSLRTGEVENNTVIRGDWVKGVVISDSPHDEFDNAHTQFAVDDRGRPLIGRFELHGEARGAGRKERLIGINYRPPRSRGLVLYTPWFGARTPGAADVVTRQPVVRQPSPAELQEDSARAVSLAAAREAVELPLDRVTSLSSETVYRVRPGGLTRGGGASIPAGGAVLSGTGRAAAFVNRLARAGGTVRITAQLGTHASPPRTVVGGWPRLVVDGANVGAKADSLEGTFPRFSSARHPRSAVAITRDSSMLMLVVVDGRRPWSVGMSLGELADQLIALGAFQAMNLDGGGSSTLWVRGTIVNYPSDPTGERPVGNALMIVPRR